MIGIFGGTFNPIHFGHLRPAIDVIETLQLRRLILIPCGIPPHRETPEISAAERVLLIKSAIEGESKIRVDQREIQRGGLSYTVDTLRSFRDELGDEPICLIIGKDAFLELNTWHNWQQLFQLAHLVVLHRPGYHFNADSSMIAPELFNAINSNIVDSVQELRETSHGLIKLQSVTQLNISSTHIRELIKEGKSIRFLVPDCVKRIIDELRLYK